MYRIIGLLICNLVSNTINIYLYFTDSYILHTHLGMKRNTNRQLFDYKIDRLTKGDSEGSPLVRFGGILWHKTLRMRFHLAVL